MPSTETRASTLARILLRQLPSSRGLPKMGSHRKKLYIIYRAFLIEVVMNAFKVVQYIYIYTYQ